MKNANLVCTECMHTAPTHIQKKSGHLYSECIEVLQR